MNVRLDPPDYQPRFHSELFELIQKIEDHFAQRNFEAIDEILQAVDVEKSSTVMLITYIRTTFRARELLPTWPKLMRAIRAEFSTRADASSRTLVGLPSDEDCDKMIAKSSPVQS